MTKARWFILLMCLIYFCSCGNKFNSDFENPSQALAGKIDSDNIYLFQVDSIISQDLYNELDRIYMKRKEALEVIFNNRIIAHEAQRTGVSSDAYLSSYFEKHLDIAINEYLNNDTNATIPFVKDKLRVGISKSNPLARVIVQENIKKRLRHQLADSLRVKYNVSILLSPPTRSGYNTNRINGFFIGKLDSKCKVSIFTDFDCSTCQKAYPFLNKLISKYQDKICFKIVNYSDNVYPAFMALSAANNQGKVYEMYQQLFENKFSPYDTSFFLQLADRLKLDKRRFEIDFNNQKEKTRQFSNLEEINSKGIKNTPSIIIDDALISNYASETEIDKIIFDRCKDL